jgi:hypothetical protein
MEWPARGVYFFREVGEVLNILYTDGSRETIPLRGAFERFFSETCT